VAAPGRIPRLFPDAAGSWRHHLCADVMGNSFLWLVTRNDWFALIWLESVPVVACLIPADRSRNAQLLGIVCLSVARCDMSSVYHTLSQGHPLLITCQRLATDVTSISFWFELDS
jgi:hypothetical protein